MTATGLGASSFETGFSDTINVSERDCDELGHVNNVTYLKWVQDMAIHHWTTVATQSLQDKVLFVVLRHEIDYRDPLLPGEEAEIRTWLGKAAGPRFDRHVDIRRAGARRFSAKARTTWCMLNRMTGAPQRIDDEIFDTFGVRPEELD